MGKQVQQQNLSFPTISPPDSLLAPVEILLLSPIFTIYLLYKYATYVLSLSNLALTMFQCLQSQHSSSAKLLQSIQSSTLFNFSPVAIGDPEHLGTILNDVTMPCKVDEKYWQFSVPLLSLHKLCSIIKMLPILDNMWQQQNID